MKKLTSIGESERTLFINRFSDFIKNEFEIEKFVNFMVENWNSVEIESTTKTSLGIQVDGFKNCKTFKDFYSKVFKGLQFDNSYKVTRKFNESESDSEPTLTAKFLNLINKEVIKNRISSKNETMSSIKPAGAISANIGLAGVKHGGLNSKFKESMLTKENLSNLNSKEKTLSNLFMKFRFNLFYMDSSLSLTEEEFKFGVIKIPVRFEITSRERNKYLNLKEDDLKKIIVESIKESLSSKFYELMSKKFLPMDLIERRCNSLFIKDDFIIEYFNSQSGRTSKILINSVSGDEKDRMLKLLQEFMVSDFN